MIEVARIGGANIGWFNATWPFARLRVSRTKISLKVVLSGEYTFEPSDVVEIRKHGKIPILASGIEITHTKKQYPANVIFWTFGSPQKLIDQIKNTGFKSQADSTELSDIPNGMPVKWGVFIVGALLWNALVLLDFRSSPVPGIYTSIALALLAVFAAMVIFSKRAQNLVLREGHSYERIQPIFNLLLFVSAAMGLMLGLQAWMGNAS